MAEQAKGLNTFDKIRDDDYTEDDPQKYYTTEGIGVNTARYNPKRKRTMRDYMKVSGETMIPKGVALSGRRVSDAVD